MNHHRSRSHKTKQFLHEINQNKDLFEIEKNFRLLKHAIEFNAFDAINIRLIINNKNYNIIELLYYNFGERNNFLHFLIKEYKCVNYDIFTFLIKFLKVYGLLSKFFHDNSNKEMLSPINLGFKYQKYNNVYILLSYIKNKTNIKNFYNSRLHFDIDCFKLISYLIKYKFNNDIIDDCKKNIYNKGKLWNSYFFPFPIC